MYSVKLEKFEGPLDLLHQLIESKKLEITEISLAQVADQFLSYLKNSPRFAMEDMANFLNVATVVLVAVCGILFVFAPYLIDLIAPGFSLEKKEITITLTRIMFLSPII